MKRLIRLGTRSSEVSDVQARLRAFGLSIEDEGGFFGEATERAVRAFQQTRHILVDGIVGPHTWAELVETQWRLGDRPLYVTFPAMRGDDVASLQARLNALGFDAGREDGILGVDTDRALRAFQREYGLLEDGIFGVKSARALAGLRVDRPQTAAGLRDELRRAESKGVETALVVLDPGHGGMDRGDRAPNGAFEADLCWDLARSVADRLVAFGTGVRFTRNEAESPEVSERAGRANQLRADLFLSFHLNAHEEGVAGGASTYYWPRSRAGEMLADEIQDQLVALGISDCRSHPRSYPILKETKMPAVLVEPGFITNPDDAARLISSRFRNGVADAIANAVQRYYNGST